MPTTTPPPPDLQRLAADLGVVLPSEPLNWDRVRSRFSASMVGRLNGGAAVAQLQQRRLEGDEPTEAEWTAAFGVLADAVLAPAPGAFRPQVSIATGDAERAQQRSDLLAAIDAERSATPTADQSPPPPTTRRRRFVSISRTTDADGVETLDAICEEGRAWFRIPADGGRWIELLFLPEITE